MRQIIAALLLLALAAPLAGCIIAPAPYYGYGYGYRSPRWCYYHPGACY